MISAHNTGEVIEMVLSQKETMLLNELKSQEQLCIEKYGKYAAQACDGQLSCLFADIAKVEQGHLDTINQMLSGTVPAMNGQSGAQPQPPTRCQNCSPQEKQQDAFLCQDALTMEKHVSSLYDTSIFEFKDENARSVLNHIQKEEQQHGKRIYDYMAANNMYN